MTKEKTMQKTKSANPHRRKALSAKAADKLRSVLYLTPSVVGVSLFFILPFFVVVYYSLIRSPINPEFVFLENYKNVLGNSSFQTAVNNTLKFSAMAVPLAVILSLALALMLEEKIPFKSQFRTFFLSPIMVPVASVVLIWQVLFDYNGALNEFVATFGLDKIDWLKSEYCLGVITVLYLWKNLG